MPRASNNQANMQSVFASKALTQAICKIYDGVITY